jgi:anti-anti-sigma factor
MNDFSADIDRQGDQITVSLRGELDMATAPTLEQLLDGVKGRVCFDCNGLTFVDSSGLAIFARVDRNGGAALRAVEPNVRRVLEVAGLEGLITEA